MTHADHAAFDPDRFRREAAAVVDWIARYWEQLESRPVAAVVEPGWVRAQLPQAAPSHPSRSRTCSPTWSG